MGLMASLLAPRAALNPADDRYYSMAGLVTDAGVRVTPDTALKASAVWACAGIISETLAALPLQMFQRQADGGRQVATNHPLYELLHDRPNAQQTALEFKQMLTLHTVTQYVGYPPQIQAVVRPVMKNILYLLGHDDVEQLLPVPMMPVIDPMTGQSVMAPATTVPPPQNPAAPA
jgi:hypothetical protein